MASSSTRKRTRASSDNESSDVIQSSCNPFTDRATTGVRHKRARMTTGLVSPPTEDLEMADDSASTSGTFLHALGAKRGVSGGWADAALSSTSSGPSSSRFERTARRDQAPPSGLSSPPLSPYPTSASALPLSSSRSGGLASSFKAPAAAALSSSSSGPRITLRPSPTLSSLPPSTSLSTVAPDSDVDSEDEGDDEDEGEDEAYDPEEAQLDIGVSDDDEEDGPGKGEDSSEDDDDTEPAGPSVPVPVSGMNAFLHELHLAHRRAKPQTPTRPPPSRPSSSAPMASPSLSKVQAMDARAIAAARAAAVRREAAQRREESARALAANSEASPKKGAEGKEGGEEVGAQYEETNRLLGALLLSRRKHLNLPAEDEEQGE